MNRLRSLLRDETGLGLPIAMSVLAVVMMLAALSVASSSGVNDSSEKDRGAKRALGPADAAVQRVSWRLDQTGAQAVDPTSCIWSGPTGDVVGAPGAPCPAWDDVEPTPMGNGNSYKYIAPPAQTTAGAMCAGRAAGVGDRCIVSSGTANGVTRRVQALINRPIVSQIATPWGLVGRDSVSLGNNVVAWTCDGDVAGTIGSNGIVDFGNNGDRLDDTQCDGTDDGSWGVTIQAPPAGSVSGSPAGPPLTPTQIAPPGFDFPVIAWPTSDTNNLLPVPAYNSGTKVLSITSPTTLAAGTYRVCGLVVGNGSLNIAATGTVKIYVDAPGSGSGFCTAANGTGDGVWFKNNEDINWGSNANMGTDDIADRARRLQIFAAPNPYWETPGNRRACNGNQVGTILICNSTRFAGSIYAPDATMDWRNGGEFVGFATVRDLRIDNGLNHRLPNGMGNVVTGTTTGNPEVAGWTECVSSGSGNAGCS